MTSTESCQLTATTATAHNRIKAVVISGHTLGTKMTVVG